MGKSSSLLVLAVALPLAFALSGCRTRSASAGNEERVAAGRALFGTLCARCHGAEGGGGLATEGSPAPRNFRDHAFQTALSDAQLEQAIAVGKPPAMPPFGAMVNAEQRASLVAFLRTLDPESAGHGR